MHPNLNTPLLYNLNTTPPLFVHCYIMSQSTAIVFLAISIGFVLFRNKNKRAPKCKDYSSNYGGDCSDSSNVYDCVPPLPKEVVNLLRYNYELKVY